MPKADTKEWPLEDVEQLRTLIAMGMDSRQIGERMGYSRNAVLGKTHRLGWRLQKQYKPNNGRTLATGQYRKTKPNDDLPPKEPMGEGCLWPMGDKWCGCERVSGEPYCPEHVRAAWSGMKAMPLEEAIKYFSLQ